MKLTTTGWEASAVVTAEGLPSSVAVTADVDAPKICTPSFPVTGAVGTTSTA